MIIEKKEDNVCLNRLVPEKINTGVSGFVDDSFNIDEFYYAEIIYSDYNKEDYDKIKEETYEKFSVPNIL